MGNAVRQVPARPEEHSTGTADKVDGQAASSTQSPGRSRELGFISPIVARLAQEHNLDLSQVTGTGDGGRITKKDVLAYVDQRKETLPSADQQPEAAPWETPGEGDLFRPTEMVFAQGRPGQAGTIREVRPFEAPHVEREQPPAQPAAPVSAAIQPGEGRLIPHSTMRRRIAEHMVLSKRTAPHVTTVMEADLQRVITHYLANKAAFSRDGARLTYTAYFVAAAVSALRAFPLVNSSWTDDGVYIHPQVNLGMAVSLGDEGLIVPVLKNADALSLLGLSRAIGDLASRARGRKLTAEEVQGGTFTITNHGISGSLMATPVINQPQCGILGVGAIQKRVVVIENPDGDSMAIRPMAYLSFTFDHRILDGASADGFLSKVVETLENWG
jgi:2-oxoglutarate dehydrogenase E2 component (dihydrolipoamide succinyltransferase)